MQTIRYYLCAPCPKCKTGGAETDKQQEPCIRAWAYRTFADPERYALVRCAKCGFEGPKAATMAEAVEAWARLGKRAKRRRKREEGPE